MKIVNKFKFTRFIVICLVIISVGGYYTYGLFDKEEIVDDFDFKYALEDTVINQETFTIECDSKEESKDNEEIKVNNDEVELLSQLLYVEINLAYREGKWCLSSDEEMGYVGAVVINRINSRMYPNDLKGVVFDPHQFSGVNSKEWGITTDRTDRIAKEVLQGKYAIEEDILYYFNPDLATDSKFVQSKMELVVFEAGGHVFTR